MKTITKISAILAAIFVLHLILLVNLKFTAWPEMLLWPFLMIKGWLPYANIAIAHTPLMLLKLTIFYKIFGVGIIQLKVFSWILILSLDLAVYWIAKNIWSKKTAVFSLAAFVVWQLFYDGNGLWFDLFLALPAFISFYLVEKRRWFWAGVFWAFSLISKQTAVWFLAPIAIEIFRDSKEKVRDAGRLFAGALGVGIISVLVLVAAGVFKDFWYWAVNFGIFVLPKAQGQLQLPDLKNLLVAAFPFLIFIPLLIKKRVESFNLLVWSVAGALGAYPRFEFFHFQPAIPYLAIVSGIVFTEFKKSKRPLKIFLIIYLIGSIYLFANFFIRNWGEGTRFYETDVTDVVSYVEQNTGKNDRIFVMNWWDNIYALSDRLPASDPWVPQLSWYQTLPGIQEKEVSTLSKTKPKLILLNPYTETGLSSYIPQGVYDYVLKNYTFSQKVDGIEVFIKK